MHSPILCAFPCRSYRDPYGRFSHLFRLGRGTKLLVLSQKSVIKLRFPRYTLSRTKRAAMKRFRNGSGQPSLARGNHSSAANDGEERGASLIKSRHEIIIKHRALSAGARRKILPGVRFGFTRDYKCS